MIRLDIVSKILETSDQVSNSIKTYTTEELLALLASVEACEDLQVRIGKSSGHHWTGTIPEGEKFTATFPVTRRRAYLAAVDGSQIFPDPDSPVQWSYVQAVVYRLLEPPTLFDRFYPMNDLDINPKDFKGMVSDWRSLLEMEAAAASAGKNTLVLMDGGLLPWFSASSMDAVTEAYRKNFAAVCPNLIAGIISDPNSHLIAHVISLVSGEKLDIPDTTFMKALLKKGERSAIFLYGSPNNRHFIEEQAGIHLFFMRINEHEIIRVEIPEWVARDSSAVEQVAGAILEDSSFTGYSYVLSQAHHTVKIPAEMARDLQMQADARFYARTGQIPGLSAKDRAKQA